MSLSSRIKIATLALLGALAITVGPAWVGYQVARGDGDGAGSALLAPAIADAGSAVVAAPAPAPPQYSDISIAEKLWDGGSWFGMGILALYVALFVWWKLDKKRAFYISTAIGGVGLLVESIRRGDTPNAVTLFSVLGPTIGIMLAGPQISLPHSKARLVTLVLAAGLAVGACSWLKSETKAIASDVVDCMKPELRTAAGELGSVLGAALPTVLSDSGKVDREGFKAIARDLKSDAAGCALKTAIANLLKPRDQGAPYASPLAVDASDLEAAWADVQRDQFGGRTFALGGS